MKSLVISIILLLYAYEIWYWYIFETESPLAILTVKFIVFPILLQRNPDDNTISKHVGESSNFTYTGKLMLIVDAISKNIDGFIEKI